MPLRSFSQAEMMLTERRRLERPLLVTIWLGVTTFSLAEQSLFYMVAGTLAVVVNWVAVSRGKEVFVHRVFVNAGVAVATGVLLLEVFVREEAALVLLSHYLILIQLCKLFERKRNRDYVQLLAMNVLLVMVASLISDEPWLAAMLVAYLLLACHTTMVFTLKRGLDAAASARLVTEPTPLSPQRVAWNVLRAWPKGALRRFEALVGAAILVAGALVFLLAPRGVKTGIGLFSGPRPMARSGFVSNVELGRTGRIYLSDHIVMRVRITQNEEPASAPGRGVYLRGGTFDKYSDSRWSRSSVSSHPLRPSERLRRLADQPELLLVQEVFMVPGLLPTLFACYPAIQVDSLSDGTILDADLNHTSHQSSTQDAPVRYTAYSWPQPLTEVQRQALAARAHLDEREADPGATVKVPPRVAELARLWCEDLLEARGRQGAQRDELDLEIARRIAARLEQRCTYSLDLTDTGPKRDGVEDFLFHTRRGHCEYFASALTVMCRSLGVRARLASGFCLDGSGAAGETHLVRERDAHAWTEVFTPKTDWVTVDPSPHALHEPQRGWWATVKESWQSLRFSWYEHVAGYDATSRAGLIGWFAEAVSGARQAASRAAAALREGFKNLLIHGQVDRVMIGLAVTICLLALTVEALLIVRAVRRGRRSLWAGEALTVPPWQLHFVAKLFALLGRRGLRPGPGQTALAAAREASARFHLPEGVLTELIELYYRLRWGGKPAGADEIRAAEEQVDRLAQSRSA